MMSYGTSITEGHAASRTDLAWNSLTARQVGHDLINLGSSGTAFCQAAVADYMAGQPWDLCVLEISVNMLGNEFSVEQFRRRATYMVNTLAKSHPEAPIFCISLFPWGIGDYWTNSPQHKKARQYREALKEICEGSPHGNVHFVSGSDVLSFSGLSRDMLHPSDHGMIEIADKLSERINAVLKKSRE
jgi:lysophospholipase L1-like esterase